jgi:hypothetical protein
MKLTDSEMQEFTELANATFDPDLFSEDDYPILKAARDEFEKEQAREHRGVLPIGQPTVIEGDGDNEPESRRDVDMRNCGTFFTGH